MESWQVYAGFAGIGALLIASAVCIIVFLRVNAKRAAESAMTAAKHLQGWLESAEDARRHEAEMIAIRNGENEKQTFLETIDLRLKQSGLGYKYQFLSAELAVVLWGSLILLSTLLALLLTRNIFIIIAVCVLSAFMPYVLISFLALRSMNKVKQMLIIFCDTSINISSTTTNLMELLRQVSYFMDEPLKSALMFAYNEAINGEGGQWMALYHLRQRIPEEQFDSIIQDLELASRYEADYQKILKDRKSLIEAHLASESKKRQLLNGGRLNIGIMTMVCAICINSLQDLVEGGIWALLFGSPAGIVLLVLFCLVLLYSIKTCFTTPGL
jgi:hypothetical protein